jgi:hypothetical protein
MLYCPPVRVTFPVAGVPANGASVMENVPVEAAGVSVLIWNVPVPVKEVACHAWMH